MFDSQYFSIVSCFPLTGRPQSLNSVDIVRKNLATLSWEKENSLIPISLKTPSFIEHSPCCDQIN